MALGRSCSALTLLVACISVAAAAAFVIVTRQHQHQQQKKNHLPMTDDSTTPTTPGNNDESSIQVAFVGNSMLYYNDCPRLLEHMLKTRFAFAFQNSCLRGGASLVSLLEKGNGMQKKFASRPSSARADGTYDIGAPTVENLLLETTDSKQNKVAWDFVVLNDYTQAPARAESREDSENAIETRYMSMFREATVVFVQTPAYRVANIRGTEDLGDFDAFTKRLEDGYMDYVKTVSQDANLKPARLAPVGKAYSWLYHNNRSLWKKLYYVDDFHPSPHGTWLEACVLYCTMVEEVPPKYDSTWWYTARYMQPEDNSVPQLPLPTDNEAEELRSVAIRICNIV